MIEEQQRTAGLSFTRNNTNEFDSSLVSAQIELEKKMTQCSIDKYRIELERNKQTGNFGCTSIASKLISRILDGYTAAIREYLDDYSKGKAVRCPLCGAIILVEAVRFFGRK